MQTGFKAAGVLFTDGVNVLAGFQPGKNAISGFGGSREGRETIRQTAFREAVEELLEPALLPTQLIQSLVDRYKAHPVTRKGTYRFLTLSFEDLVTVLQEANAADLQSQIYTTIPTTMAALIRKRKPLPSTEVSRLTIVSVHEPTFEGLDEHFAADLQTLSSYDYDFA